MRRNRIIRAFAFVAGVMLFSAPAWPEGDGTRVVLRGTGTPHPDPVRQGPALAIVVNDSSYLVDCGTGCVRQMAKAVQDLGISALQYTQIAGVFFTHLHSDHTLGYPDLMLTLWDIQNQPLPVYGPVGIIEMTDAILQAYEADITVRTEGFQQSDPTTLRPKVTVIGEGEIFSDDNVMVTAFRVPHGTCCPVSYGFKFVTSDRTIVISGDPSKSEEVAKQARRADVLIHEVYSAKKYESASDTFRQYLRSFHTSATELAEVANKAKPGMLILTHQLGTDECDTRGLADEVRKAGYRGKISNGNDLDVFWVFTEHRPRRASASSRRAE